METSEKICANTTTPARPVRRERSMNEPIYYGMDFSNGPSYTAVIVWYGGRAYGKTFFARLWMQYYYPDLVSQHLIRRLAAEAVINISINN